MPVEAEPVLRPAARVVLLDREGRILLLRIADAPMDVASAWITPGGALQPGESYEAAALRLAQLLPPLIAGRIPEDPIDAGE